MKLKVLLEQGHTKLVKAGKRFYWLPLWSDDISKGVLYSLPWSDIVPQSLADILMKREIYTLDDLISQPKLANVTMSQGVDYFGLILTIKERYNGE